MKNTTLKTVSVLLCVLLILSLSACNKKGSSGSSSIMPSSSVPPPNQPISSSMPEEGEGSQAQSQPESSSQPASSASSGSEVKMQDGSYDGQAQGYNGPVKVKVTIAEGKITKVELTEQTETKDVAQQALDEIPARIVEKNTPKVDIVAGATLSSNAIIRAVEDAVEKASQQSGASSSK